MVFTVFPNVQDDDVYVWTENSAVRERLSTKLRHSSMDLRVNLTDDFYARVRLMLPPDFDENLVYPAVVNV